MSYVGVPPFGQTVRTITEVTATAGQTVFTPSGGYLPGYIDVTLNGAALTSADFTATNGTTVTLTVAAAVGDEFRCVAYWPVSLADTYRKGETDALLAGKLNTTAGAVGTNNLADGAVTSAKLAPGAGGQFFGAQTTKAIAYNSNTITENVTITSGNNATSAGPMTIANTFTVTVQDNANWVIV